MPSSRGGDIFEVVEKPEASVADSEQARWRMGVDETRPKEGFVGPSVPLQFALLAFSHNKVRGLISG